VVRLLAYTNYANMGIYRDAVTQFLDHTSPAPETVPDITNHPWHITRKYGFGVNVEQNLARYVTAYARWGWDNGKTESLPTPRSIRRSRGCRGEWRALASHAGPRGYCVRVDGIKKDHQVYLADGGLGFLLGDGGLNYGRENVVETYYTVHVWRGIYVAPGVQHINDPGYNRDRGPVVVPTLRAHVEF